MIAMHKDLAYARADEVAECYDGIAYDGPLYRALWAMVLSGQDVPQETHDDVRSNHWFALLPEALQVEANAAAEEHWRVWKS
jgi:hypothetical protein